mmetsp:Transcript_37530/g.91251  ORF Transcript_37530/g.91251 Transcript_37530/m.91251 type:complete len:81 (-) Transcript_37530:1262-1504(-)
MLDGGTWSGGTATVDDKKEQNSEGTKALQRRRSLLDDVTDIVGSDQNNDDGDGKQFQFEDGSDDVDDGITSAGTFLRSTS